MSYQIIRATQQDGVKVTLNQEGGLKVKGDPDLVKKWLQTLQAEKDSIISCLTTLWINPYCDEQTFKQYGNQMAMEQGLDRVHKLYRKALKIGISDGQAWDFGEGVAVGEFSGDNRRACLECNHYRHRQGSDHGVCTAAGTALLQHMAHGASVNWDWLNRCPMHTAR
jgi:hypothetical protein